MGNNLSTETQVEVEGKTCKSFRNQVQSHGKRYL